MLTRRHLIRSLPAAPLGALLPSLSQAQATTPAATPAAKPTYDATALKAGYKERLKKILTAGALPYIDLESSCNSTRLDIDFVVQNMDRLNIGLMALSADIGEGQFKKGVRFDRLSDKLMASYPDHFIPVGNGGQGPALTETPDEFFDAQDAAIKAGEVFCLGEFEFRHYPSPRQVKRGESEDRNVQIPIDGPIGHRLFSTAEKTGMAFQIHYEVEDELLPPLEKMLAQYPKARVVWCHIAQVRYIERASRYTPAYIDGLLKRFPQLSFDTAFGDSQSTYKPSGQRHARIWGQGGAINPEWRDVLVAHPTRFLSALDLGADRIDQIAGYDVRHRYFLQQLPPEVQHQVAYRNAWQLLFGEAFA